MKFKKHLETGIGVPLLAFLLFSTVFYLQVRWIGKSISQVTDIEAPRCKAISNMEVELNGINFGLIGYLNDPQGEGVSWIGEYKNKFREHMAVYCGLSEIVDSDTSIEEIDKNSSLLCRIAEEIVNLNTFQLERIDALRGNLEEVDNITEEQYNRHIGFGAEQSPADLRPVMEARMWERNMEEALHCFMVTHSKSCEKKLYKSQQQFRHFLNEYKAVPSTLDSQWTQRLSELHSQIDAQIKDIIALDYRKLARLDNFRVRKDLLRMVLAEEVKRARAGFELADQKSRSAITASTVVMLFLVFFGLIVAFISQQYVNFMIIQPLGRLLSAANKIGRGIYETRVDVDSDDELGELAASLNNIAEQKQQEEKSKRTSADKSPQQNKMPLSV